LSSAQPSSKSVQKTKEMLARAFHDDPPNVWMFPDERKRRAALEAGFTMSVRYGARYGQVYSTDGTNEGAAIWLPPDSPRTSMPRMLRVGLWEMISVPLTVGLGVLPRLFSVMGRMEELHKKDAPKRHWYLMALGVEPKRQGQGVGSALMQPGLEQADRDRLPCYLETAKEINLDFYKKHGFEVVRKIDLPQGGPPVWTMLREPIG